MMISYQHIIFSKLLWDNRIYNNIGSSDRQGPLGDFRMSFYTVGQVVRYIIVT